MANSGKAHDALEYYHRALDLNAGYIRARCVFRLSVLFSQFSQLDYPLSDSISVYHVLTCG